MAQTTQTGRTVWGIWSIPATWLITQSGHNYNADPDGLRIGVEHFIVVTTRTKKAKAVHYTHSEKNCRLRYLKT